MGLDREERRIAAWIEEGERPEAVGAVPRGGARDLPAARVRGIRSEFDHGSPRDDRAARSEASPAELRRASPETRWAGPASDRTLLDLEAHLAVEAGRLGEDPGRITSREQAELVRRAMQVDAPIASAPLSSDTMPREYDASAAQEAIEGLAERVDRELDVIRTGPSAAPVPGRNIIPGSIPVSALGPRGFGASSTLPGERSTVVLRIAQDTDTDHWAVDGSAIGPGRVWKVVDVDEGPDFSPDGGPIRYRLVGPDQRFGIMSLELQHSGVGSGDPILQTNYGIVVRGIPTYGLTPTRIVEPLAAGDFPISYATQVVATNGNPDGPFSLLGDAAQGRYQTASPPFMVELESNTFISPQGGGIERCDGFAFGLITGETDEAVYRQMNTRRTTYGRVWRRDGILEGASLSHSGMVGGAIDSRIRPPCPGQTIEWDGQAGGTSPGYDQIGLGSLATENRLVEGIPLLYPDCAKLTRRADSFSMVVQPLVIRSKTLQDDDSWPSPANWAAYGMETVAGVGRSWALDVIIH
ncbi:MAG: hypothetical protein GY719_23680 [bacterium]|nr:hypothetical protein [bacterium]